MNAESRTEELSPAGGSYWIPLVLGGLLVWRWLLPPENVLLGGTLWIAQCSLLLPVTLTFLLRKGPRRLVWGWLDTGLWIIVLGHWISFGWMLFYGGNLRTGFNLCWEWTALGATVFVMRQVVRERTDRQDLLRLLLIVGISFAGLGLWQHYVTYRTTISDYQQLVSRIDELVSKAESTGLTRLEQRELQRLTLQVQEMEIPLAGPGRELFERRLADSRQPVARWALANSLGGLLAVTAILLLSGVLTPGRARWWLLVCLVPVIVCLWQTQSRTALVALLSGGFFFVLRQSRLSDRSYQRFAFGSLLAGVVLGGLLLAWGMSRLDRIDVESNYALRSLQFRMQYWSGSLSMLIDSPIFGSGPGNFREHYLRYKLAASSEQIADPHNAFIDLWANGGLAALAGWLLIVTFVLSRIVRLERVPASAAETTRDEKLLSSPWMLGAELALLGQFLFILLTTGEFDKPLVAMAVGLPFLDAALQRIVRIDARSLATIAAFALGVHLLGAGGIEMPGIVLIGVVLLVVSSTDAPRYNLSRIKSGLAALATLLLAGGMWRTTTAPVMRAQVEIQAGWDAWIGENNLARSQESFGQAILSDPFDPESPRLLARLSYTAWLQERQSEAAFEPVIQAWNEASRRDPWSSKDDLYRADAYWARYERTSQRDDALQAVEWYEQADVKRPHDEQILSGLAFAAEAAGMVEKSQKAAESAIKVHELSRKNGHWEKMLPEAVLERLKSLRDQ